MSHVKALGYLGFNVTDMDAWQSFASGVLGLQEGQAGRDDSVRFRMDDRAYRFALHVAKEDGVAYVGWEVATEEALDALSGDLDRAGVAWKEAPEVATIRGVRRLITCQDPAGRTLEFSAGATSVTEPFVSPRGARFVTRDPRGQDLGLGHVVLTYPELSEARAFYFDVLKFRHSDTIVFPDGRTVLFTHVNPRHHSLAFAQTPPGKSPAINHFMLEVTELDTVGRAIDRVNHERLSQIASLGRHTNDLMLSFYVRSPSGWGVEYGCEGRLIDDEVWTTSTYTAGQLWGHDPEED